MAGNDLPLAGEGARVGSRLTSLESYLGAVCDLDGVVYRGPEPIPHAVESLRAWGRPVVFATNNASREPEEVADQLSRLGLETQANDVVTSSLAAAWVLKERVPHGALVLAVGGAGVSTALAGAGYEVVRRLPSGARVAAVVQGYGPQVTAADLAEAAYAIQGGALWVATNTDSTLPTERGIAPGNGSLIGAVARAVQREPDCVAGKPSAPCYLLAAERLGLEPSKVLAIGDRLDTDIAGAHAAAMDSLLVLTGVHGRDDVACAPPQWKPTYVVEDLRALARPPRRLA